MKCLPKDRMKMQTSQARVVVAVVVIVDVTRLEMIAVNEQNKNK